MRVEGRFDEALAAYTALMRSLGHFCVDVAMCLMALGRSAEAVPLLEEAIRLDRDMRPRFKGYLALGGALVRIGRYEEAISWLRAGNEASHGSAPGIWTLAIAYAHTGKVADARRELLEYRKRIGGLPTARWLRLPAGALAEVYAREAGGPFIALLLDHVSEDADRGLPVTEGVRSANLIDWTPIGAPGVSTINTSELPALIGRRRRERRPPEPERLVERAAGLQAKRRPLRLDSRNVCERRTR